MVEPTKPEKSDNQPVPGERVLRRHSSSEGSEEPHERRGSNTRRISLTGGLKEGGQKVASAVGAFFKDRRGELVDREDDPEYVRSHPAWEEDLNKYLPLTQSFKQPWNPTSAAGPSTSSQPGLVSGLANVASTSSTPPMVPSTVTGGGTGNSAMDSFLGIKSTKQHTVAASRWHKAYEFVQRQNALKNKALSSPLGTGAKLDGHAFGIVPKDDETRLSIFNFWYQSNAEYWLAGLIAGHIMVIILKAETKFVTPYIPPKKHLNNADIALTAIFTSKRIYASSLQQARRCNGYRFMGSYCPDVYFRERNIHPLCNFSNVSDLVVSEAYQFLWECSSRYGFHSSRCLANEDNIDIYCYDDDILHLAGCDLLWFNRLLQPYGNPNWGLSSFDNFASGMLILFQMMTVEGWARLMYTFDDANGLSNAYFCTFVVIGAYFVMNIYVAAISTIFLRVRQEHQALLKKHRQDKAYSFAAAAKMASLMKDAILRDDANLKLSWRQRLGLKTSITMEKFKRSLSRQGSKFKRTISRSVDWNDPNSYLKRISSFGLDNIDNMALEEAGQPLGQRSFGRSLSRNLSQGGRQAAQLGRSFSMGMIFAGQTTSQKCRLLVGSKVFMWTVLLIISLNMAGLCTFRAHMSRQHIKRLEAMEIGMLVLFSLEMGLRLVAAGGLKEFFNEGMNIIDVVVIALSCGSAGFGRNKPYPNLTVIRMFRWFYKKDLHKQELGEKLPIVVLIIKSSGALASVFFFLTLIILVYAIAGMQLWGGHFSSFTEGYPRANYDTIFQSMLIFFSVTTAENWPDNLWNTMRGGVPFQWMGPILFISYYLLSTVVSINLIMAVILEQSQLTDNQKKYLQKRKYIKWLQTKRMHHSSSTRNSDWLVGAVEGAQKGYKEMKKNISAIKDSRMSLFPVFQPETGYVRMLSASQAAEPPPPTMSESVLPATSAQTPAPAMADTKPPSTRHAFGTPAGDVTAPLPGAIADLPPAEARTKARIFRRSSLSALNTVGLLPERMSRPHMRRRASLDADRVLVRSGFKDGLKPVAEGENRTALQKALLNVVQEQKETSKLEELQKSKLLGTGMTTSSSPLDPRLALKQKFGKMPSRKEMGPRISFSMADYEGIRPEGLQKSPWWMSERSLFLFHPDNKFRVFCRRVADNTYYLWWQYLFICLSLFITMEQLQLGKYNITREFLLSHPYFLDPFDHLVLAVFSLDFLIKIIAYGFLFAPDAYLGDPFNFIDVFSLIVHIGKANNRHPGVWFNTMLILSATRPARFFVRERSLRSLIIAILRTMPAITQMLVFTVVIYSMFAIIGMQLYANKFRTCTDSSVKGHLDCVGFFYNAAGILDQRTWINPPFHFDSFGDAMLALFVLSTFDNWLDNFAYYGMDIAHQHELQPHRNISPFQIIFFVSFVCVGGFFMLRLFIGIFVDQFGLISGAKLLTERQKLWRDINILVQNLKPTVLPDIPKGQIRRLCHIVIHSRKFELCITYALIINYVYIGYTIKYGGLSFPQLMAQLQAFQKVETMFVCLYMVEAIAKLLATQFADWWHHKWNAAELVLVLVSACSLYNSDPHSFRRQTGQIAYLLRVFRIIRYVPPLRNMVSSMMATLPSSMTILYLAGIVLYLAAGIAKFVFPHLRAGSCYGGPKDNATYATFTTGFVLLLQVMTFDNWSCLIADMTIQQPYCKINGSQIYKSDCGLPNGGIVFMLVVAIVGGHVIANLFVAQIIDCMSFGLLEENTLLSHAHLLQYQHLWAHKEFDFYCTGYIGQHKLKEFLHRLGPPLGVPFHFKSKWMSRIEYEVFNFRSPKGISFRSLLETLVLYKIGPKGLELPIRVERERQIQALYRTGAAIKLQAFFRGHLQRKGFYKNHIVEKKEEESPVMETNPQGMTARFLRTTSSFLQRQNSKNT